jgi:preprotein translocase subunit YajC
MLGWVLLIFQGRYMNQLDFFLLLGAPGGGAPEGGIGQFMGFFPILAIFAIMYFLMIRPQQKQRKETQRMLSELKKGDRVVTIGGVHGVVQSLREGSVILKVDEDCKIEFTRSAIASMEAPARDKGEGGENAG